MPIAILSNPTCQLYLILSCLSSIEIVKERDDTMLSPCWILEEVPKYVRIEPKMIINIKELTEI